MSDIAHQPSPFVDWGVAGAAVPGEPASGDLHVVCHQPNGTLLAVVDGLGHGPEAALAAQRAAETIGEHCDQSVIGIVRLCHKALAGTRGVAMSIASFNITDETMTWLAIGNVEGLLVRADPRAVPTREAVVMRGGVVGYELPIVRAAVTTVSPGDVLIFATDGIRSAFTDQIYVGRRPQALADNILTDHAKGTDDALVLVARYTGRPK